jgi:hypothetical protein
MTDTRIVFTEPYDNALCCIEDFLFSTSQDLQVVDAFWADHDQVLNFICENPTTPAVHPTTGDQSWPFADGRYRLFFKVIKDTKESIIYFTHIIDNRQANLSVYPGNKMPTFDES